MISKLTGFGAVAMDELGSVDFCGVTRGIRLKSFELCCIERAVGMSFELDDVDE